MELVLRHRLSLAIVLLAVAATVGFLVFGLPRSTTPNAASERVVDFAHVRRYSPAVVRRVFAEHGLRLRYANKELYLVWLSASLPPVPTSALYVLVATGRGASWGPKPAGEYDQPVGNLLVHYGGSDPATLARVKAAVAALRG